MKPYSFIYLVNFNSDVDYSNVIDFSSKQAQENYFLGLNNMYILDKYSYIRKNHTVKLALNIDTVKKYNYLFYKNIDGKLYFNFILDHVYINENTTEVILKLDVWQTYHFDYSVNDSFVERTHVNRWNGDTPTINTVDEGLPVGEYIIDNEQVVCSYDDGLIISSTQPLGVCEGFNLPSNGNGSTGEPSDGNPSKTGFRFIKGYEGFSPTGLYLNNENFKTVGYGSTETSNIDYYNKHKPFPCSEQLASEIFAERYTNDFGKLIWNECVKLGIEKDITKQKLDAMTSLAYNCGFYGFTQWSTSPWHLIKNNPNNPTIRNTWLTFAITGGTPPVEMEGLKLRRIAESNIYFDNIYEMRSILKYKDNGSGVGVSDGVVEDNRGDGFIPDYLPDLSPQLEIIIER